MKNCSYVANVWRCRAATRACPFAWEVAGLVDEAPEVAHGDGMAVDSEPVDARLVRRALLGIEVVGAHGERAAGDPPMPRSGGVPPIGREDRRGRPARRGSYAIRAMRSLMARMCASGAAV